MDLTSCPSCDSPAEIIEQFTLRSTDGPVEHMRITCVRRHWFLLPVPRPRRPSDDVASPGDRAARSNAPS